MKKLWVALAMMLVLLCWGSAGAEALGYTSCPNAEHENNPSVCQHYDEDGNWISSAYMTLIDVGYSHQFVCPECGRIYEEEHDRYYDGHIDDRGDELYHYRNCDLCDGMIEREEHRAWCDVGVCEVCGSTNVGEEALTHRDARAVYVDQGDGETHRVDVWCAVCDDYDYLELYEAHDRYYDGHIVDLGDELYHYRNCDQCGGLIEREEHRAWCNVGVCEECGSTNVGEEALLHSDWRVVYVDQGDGKTHRTDGWCAFCDDYDYGESYYDHVMYYGDLNDAKTHQYMCKYCGYAASEPEVHTVLCTDPDEACTVCGTTYTYYATVQHTDVVYNISEYSHSQNCNACGEHLDWGAHTVKCTQPGVCTVCGGTDVLTYPDHSWQYVDQGNGMHLRKCADCGKNEGTSNHFRECTDNGTACSLCGAANVETVVHDYGYVDQGDGETHMEICVACGEEFGESQHTRYCTDEGSGCSLCGSDDVVYVYHWETYVDKGDGKHHTEICEECGETLNEYEHWVNCTEPGVCEACGSTNVGGVGILHPTASIKYVDLGKKHQQQCTECGQKWAADWHWAYCNDTTTCRICKLTGLTLPSDQYTHRGTFTDLGASHRFTCNYCDCTTTESHWVYCTDQSECYQCGATGFEITWENRYCTGTTEVLSYDDNGHTFTCSDCKQTYTEPHSLDDDGNCSCGYVKAAAGLPGDADNNSRVTLNDAIAILEGSVSNDANADVNGDGKTDLNDALRILQYLAGWNVSLQ